MKSPTWSSAGKRVASQFGFGFKGEESSPNMLVFRIDIKYLAW